MGAGGARESCGGGGGGAVLGAVSQHCGESNAGEVCMWEELCGGSCVGEAVGELCFIHVSDPFTEVNIYVTLWHVPVDVLPRLFLWFSQVKYFECHCIQPPQVVVCVHMYSVAGT